MMQVPLSMLAPRDGESVTLDIEGMGSFVLHLRRPTAGEMLASVIASMRSPVETVQARLVCVTGWDGIHDQDGQPIAFTRERLEAMIAIYPDVAIEITVVLSRWFSGPSEESKKNSALTSPESSAEPLVDQ